MQHREALPKSMKKQVTIIRQRSSDQPLKVAAYCRVSTDQSSQTSSLENQESHYRTLISSHKGWIFAGVYSDPGLSGTHMASRPGLQKMLADAITGKIDLILTKSISRFARNTTECLNAVRMLVACNVHIYFEKENINTQTMDSELLLTLHSVFAREESRIISSNVQWAVKKRFESGTYRYSKAPYGYFLENGTFVVNEEQADVIRDIFAAVLEGKGGPAIAAELNQRGISTGTKRKDGTAGVWTASRIQGIIKNPVYIGDILMQKTYSDDQFYRKINHGEKDQYYMDSHHEAIISRDIFDRANIALRQRGKEKGSHSRYDDLKAMNTPHTAHLFSGRLVCAECGHKLKRITQAAPQNKRYYWGCTEHLKDRKKCGMKRVSEESIQNAFLTMLNKLKFAEGKFFPVLMDTLRKESLSSSPDAEQLQKIIDDNNAKRLELIRKAESGIIDTAVYQIENQEFLYEDQVALDALDKIERGSYLLAQARILRNIISRWEYSPSAPFPGEIFSQICEDVTVGTEIVFHLKCGCFLTECILADNN